jgi:hypothetical protein
MNSKTRFCSAGLLMSAAALVFATGCYQLRVRVAQAVPIDKPQQRVFVVVHEGPRGPNFARDLSKEISARLARHVANRYIVMTGLEFDSGPLDREIEAFGADGVLVVKPLDIRIGGRYGSIEYISFSATLLDLPSKQAIWVAKAEADGPGDVWWFAEGIVATLAKSRMIPPAPVPPPGPVGPPPLPPTGPVGPPPVPPRN